MKLVKLEENVHIEFYPDEYQVFKMCLWYCSHRMQKHHENGLKRVVVRTKFDKFIKDFNDQSKDIK